MLSEEFSNWLEILQTRKQSKQEVLPWPCSSSCMEAENYYTSQKEKYSPCSIAFTRLFVILMASSKVRKDVWWKTRQIPHFHQFYTQTKIASESQSQVCNVALHTDSIFDRSRIFSTYVRSTLNTAHMRSYKYQLSKSFFVQHYV